MAKQYKVDGLAVWSEPASGKARARLLQVHGLGEHSGRYAHWVKFLNERGIDVVRFDLRGSGQSEGKRQWVDRFGDYPDDVGKVLAWTRKELDDKPLFLAGHSLGGLIALYFASEHGDAFRGLLLNAPAFQTGAGVSALKIFIGRLLVRIAPGLKIPSTLDITAVSRDQGVVEAYQKDPLNCSFNTVRQGNEILDAMERLPEHLGRVRLPVILTHGEEDRLVDPGGSRKLFPLLGTQDKTLELFKGGYHELHNDLQKAEYFDRIGKWIDRHLPG